MPYARKHRGELRTQVEEQRRVRDDILVALYELKVFESHPGLPIRDLAQMIEYEFEFEALKICEHLKRDNMVSLIDSLASHRQREATPTQYYDTVRLTNAGRIKAELLISPREDLVFESSTIIVYGSVNGSNLIQSSHEFMVNATESEEVADLIEQLRRIADSVDLDSIQQSDFEAHVETAAAQIRLSKPAPGIVAAAMNSAKNILESAGAQALVLALQTQFPNIFQTT